MKEDLLKIINNYGVQNQLKHFNSEVFELNEAIMLLEHYEEFANDQDYQPTLRQQKAHITEEIADVMVMLKQFQYYYGIEDEQIEEVMKYKINRQIERIGN